MSEQQNWDTKASLGDVRDAHKFDEQKLIDYCAAQIDGFDANAGVRQFAGGQSNPTFMIETPLQSYVLRKQPPGELLASAHQVDREYRVMKALADTDVPVPTMFALCQDKDVIGTDFYVMEFLPGRVFRNPQLPGETPEVRAKVYDEMGRVMAAMHNVDVEAVGLGDFGRPGNYFERQIGRWTKQYRAAETEQISEMESLLEWLPDQIPNDNSVSIAHGDYRLENTIFHADKPEMLAVLDWELCTIGHPLADVAYNCMLYHMESLSMGTIMDLDYAALGIPTEDDYVAAYCKRTGRDGIPNWNFYLAFAIFRLAAISQGVYKRGLDGNAANPDAAKYGSACKQLAEVAWDLAQKN